MSTPTLRPLALGELLDVAFTLYRELFASLVLVSVVTSGAPALIGVYLDPTPGVAGGGNLLLYFANQILALVMGAIGIAASTFIVSDHYLGESLSAGAALGRAAQFAGRLIVASFLIGLVVFCGLVLLIVPGIILACGLAVSPTALVLERLGPIEAMGRSWNLTRGYRGKVFGTLLITVFLIVLPYIALGAVSAVLIPLAGSAGVVLAGLLMVTLGVLISPFFYVALTVLYYDLRIRKEGFDLEVLANTLRPA
jgi:hypothetical protein